jgi:hypothetical protein
VARFAVFVAFLSFLTPSLSCGGDDSEQGAGQAQTAIEADAQERAETIVLSLDDFPSGWRAEPEDDEENQGPECLDLDFSDLTVNGRAESPDFLRGEATLVSSLAAVFDSANAAEAAFERLANQGLADCLADWMREQSDEDVQITDASAGELAFPDLGDRSAAYQVALQLETEGFTPSAFADLVFIQRERALSLLMFVDVLTPFPDDEKEELATAVAGRMEPGA